MEEAQNYLSGERLIERILMSFSYFSENFKDFTPKKRFLPYDSSCYLMEPLPALSSLAGLAKYLFLDSFVALLSLKKEAEETLKFHSNYEKYKYALEIQLRIFPQLIKQLEDQILVLKQDGFQEIILTKVWLKLFQIVYEGGFHTYGIKWKNDYLQKVFFSASVKNEDAERVIKNLLLETEKRASQFQEAKNKRSTQEPDSPKIKLAVQFVREKLKSTDEDINDDLAEVYKKWIREKDSRVAFFDKSKIPQIRTLKDHLRKAYNYLNKNRDELGDESKG